MIISYWNLFSIRYKDALGDRKVNEVFGKVINRAIW